ncbi:hypothetical protein DEJ50_04590 [Streptomyces venezuelae]|uniref:Uncharacterized protein n=1 Tax=Streptomyces venezuelae TaxID=54571 RepID=A0A5P2CZ20_STRVZ|nr:hypothetical protein [Streptomyces venezuelae]QES47217.1 hypothetical protein DEJ50_04590 [Streptomyces venezuelae]
MRIISVVTFSLPVDFSLSSLIEDRAAVVGPLRSCFPGLRLPPPADGYTGEGEPADEDIVLDYPEPNHAARIENALLDGTLRIQDAELGVDFTARVYVSSLSIGFVVFELPACPDDIDLHIDKPGRGQELRDLEAPYRKALGRQIRTWCAGMKQALVPLGSVGERTAEDGMLPAARMLWWHRVLIEPGDNVPVSVRVGVTCTLGETSCTVGYLFSRVTGADEESLQEYVNGLILASQNWLIIDDATRLTSTQLMRIETDGPHNQAEIDRQYDEILDLTDKATFRSVIFSESIRYVSNSQLTVKNTVDQAWGISEEGRTLTDRMAALREIFNLRRERVANRRDEFRNKVIVALTSLAIVQCVFVWYDFYTEDKVKTAPQPRPLIAYAVLIVFILGLLVVPLAASLWRRLAARLRRNAGRRSPQSPPRPPVQGIPGPRTGSDHTPRTSEFGRAG